MQFPASPLLTTLYTFHLGLRASLLGLQNNASEVKCRRAVNTLKLNDEETVAQDHEKSVKSWRVFHFLLQDPWFYCNIWCIPGMTVSNMWRSTYLAFATARPVNNFRSNFPCSRLCHIFVFIYVSSRLDSCNCLLCPCPIKKLQSLQNSGVQLIHQDHAKPPFRILHWLPLYSLLTCIKKKNVTSIFMSLC